ncbi:MAG: 1,4-beta-xylanase [Planctomycetota bacterium]
MPPRWTADRAADWLDRTGWLVGANYTPRTASNALEFWQAETFDPATIEEELRWSAGLGFNCHRVYLHDLLWEDDAAGFLGRLDRVLDLFDATGHRVVLTLFDDCWNPEPRLGPQPEPDPGVHNSRWAQSPALSVKARWDADDRRRVGDYVRGVVDHLRHRDTVALWDLYNEPGARPGNPSPTQGFASQPILEDVFAWAREAEPDQPLTAGLHQFGDAFAEVNQRQRELSDVLSFHHYGPPEQLPEWTAEARGDESATRPLVCTEYMARTRGCTFATHLPFFREHRIGALHWGLVDGRTQTKYAWDTPRPGEEPDPWFHEVLHADGSPYRDEEADLIRRLTGGAAT